MFRLGWGEFEKECYEEVEDYGGGKYVEIWYIVDVVFKWIWIESCYYCVW